MINGATIENGERKAMLRIMTANAKVLRLRNAMRPEEATTALKQTYYVAQLAVAGALEPHPAAEMLRPAIDLLAARTCIENRSTFRTIKHNLNAGDFYAVMRELGEVMDEGKSRPEHNRP